MQQGSWRHRDNRLYRISGPGDRGVSAAWKGGDSCHFQGDCRVLEIPSCWGSSSSGASPGSRLAGTPRRAGDKASVDSRGRAALLCSGFHEGRRTREHRGLSVTTYMAHSCSWRRLRRLLQGHYQHTGSLCETQRRCRFGPLQPYGGRVLCKF